MAVKIYRDNDKLSAHFTVNEFKCSDSEYAFIEEKLVKRLEKFWQWGVTSVVITSGYRTPDYSVKVGGARTDAHTKGLAVDIICYKGKKALNSIKTACIAQEIGFSGIGIIDETAVHVDVRTKMNYTNSHWWGDERKNLNNINDFYSGFKC